MKNENEPMDSTEDTTSRRSLLKKLGVGAGIAWTAPVISTLNTPAFAATISGLNAFQFVRSGSSWSPQTPTAGTCAPAGFPGSANLATGPGDAAGVTVGGGPGTPSFTLSGGCTPTSGLGSGNCTAGSVAGSTIAFSDNSGGGQGNGSIVRFFASCP